MASKLLVDHGRGRAVTLYKTDLSITELARRTGYSAGYVSRVLRGERKAGAKALEAFASHLKVSAKALAKLIADEKA